jgi:small subunit ribosomal protein S8
MDSIGDGFTRIRNAAKARRETVSIPYSKIMESILVVLKKEGFLADFNIEEATKSKKSLVAQIRYERSGEPVIEHIRRISKPGQRVYGATPASTHLRSGLGFQILSTSKGVMTDRQASTQKVGGELLGEVW